MHTIQGLKKEHHSKGISWDSLTGCLARYEASKLDVTTKDIYFTTSDNKIVAMIEGVAHSLTTEGMEQMLGRLSPTGISYLKECPDDLLVVNLNHWLAQRTQNVPADFLATRPEFKSDARTLVARTRQTKDGAVLRGLVTERYAVLDHHQVLADLRTKYEGHMKPVGITLNDANMSLRLVSQEFKDVSDRQVGDMVSASLDARNSEIATGPISLRGGIWRLVCLNGMVSPVALADNSKRHVGKVASLVDFFERSATRISTMTNELMELTSKAYSEEVPAASIAPLFNYMAKQYSWNVQQAVDVTQDYYTVQRQQFRQDTKFAVLQAITHAAQAYEQDTRLDMEQNGGDFLSRDLTSMLKDADAYEAELAAKAARKATRK